MSAELNASWVSQPQFNDTISLRQSVMSKEDEYSRYEQAVLMEINELRRDPVAYSFVVETEATVGYPFVRDDPLPEHCSEMTLEQLRVYIEDFQKEKAELTKTMGQMQKEWTEADAGMKDRWSQEDMERAKKAKRGTGRKARFSTVRDEDLVLERQRAGEDLRDRYTQQIGEAEARVLHLERSCKRAIEGANSIINCVQQLRGLSPMPALEYSRSLTLAARDVGNECHGEACTSTKLALPRSLKTYAQSSPYPRKDSTSCITEGVPASPTVQVPFSEKKSNCNGRNADTTSQENNGESQSMSLADFVDDSPLTSVMPPTISSRVASESELLKRATMKACERYGYFSGVVRGVQLCKAFPPRKMLIQMLLERLAPQFTLFAPNATRDSYESLTNSLSPILWSGGRLLGGGLVLAPDGVVSVTVLIATSFEELSVIHERHDFSLPQIHRILNTGDGTRTSGMNRSAVVLIHSFLGVRVVEPTAHPLFLSGGQRVVRLVARADPNLVQITATVTMTTDPVPFVPLLDRELLLVQHCQDNLEEVEILLDTLEAQRRWPDKSILVHLFERNRGENVVGSFVNIGFVRIVLAEQTGRCVPKKNQSVFLSSRKSLDQQQREQADTVVTPASSVFDRLYGENASAVEGKPCGWPLVTSVFQEYCATIIEPLRGTWILFGAVQRVKIQIPHSAYLSAHINKVRALLEKENEYLRREATSGSRQRINDLIASTKLELKRAEEMFSERADPMQQELAQIRKSMARRRGRELTKLKKQEEELQNRFDELEMNIRDLRLTISSAEEDLVLMGREHTLRYRRQKRLQQEYERTAARMDFTKPLRVEVLLVDEGVEPCVKMGRLILHPVDAAGVVYEGQVNPLRFFRGCAVLFVNDQEAVRWEVRPGY